MQRSVVARALVARMHTKSGHKGPGYPENLFWCAKPDEPGGTNDHKLLYDKGPTNGLGRLPFTVYKYG